MINSEGTKTTENLTCFPQNNELGGLPLSDGTRPAEGCRLSACSVVWYS